MRLIDADELLEHAYRDRLDSRERIADMINNAPTVKEIPVKVPLSLAIKALDQEPKTGRWIKSRDCYGNNHFTCPFCEHDIATKADTLGDNYCSNCGAKLQESGG